jgi:uncharacterized membrane protein YdbT with pleckstrin-like domain
MAQSYLQSLMSEREIILYTARQHWFLLISSIFLEIILILIFLAVTVTVAVLFPAYALIAVAVGFALILIPVATMTRDILSFSNHQYIITNRRVIHLSGVLDKTITDSSLEKVNDVKMTQSALGRIFDYGDIEILTASELGVNLFKRIDKPVRFKTAMLNAKSRLESGEDLRGFARAESVAYTAPAGPEGIPALIAQLDALRQQGVLTEAEFQQKKTELLAKIK